MKTWLCKQEPDYKLLQFWCKAWMGGLFPPSVLFIDNLPLKPWLHKSGGSVNAGAPEYCLTDGDIHFSSYFPYIFKRFPLHCPIYFRGCFSVPSLQCYVCLGISWHPSPRLVASQIDFQEETLLHEHRCDVFGLLSFLSV